MRRGSIAQHPSSVGPPPTVVPMGAERDGGKTLDDSYASGGAGFTNQLPSPELGIQSAWHAVTGTDITDGNGIDDLEHLQHLLTTTPEVEGAIYQGVLLRLRAALMQLPTHTKYDAPTSLPAGDVVMLARLLLKKLR